jgi:putative ABC transport system permease protein
MLGTLRQTAALLMMGLRSLPQRKGSAGVVIVGIAVVVAVLVSVLGIVAGLERMLKANGRPDTIILLSSQSDSETASKVARADYDSVATLPEVAKSADGHAAVSPEIVTIFPGLNRAGDEGNISLRGIGAQGFALHPEIQLTAGRLFHSGLREMIVGAGVVAQFRGFELGSQVHVGNTVWIITGYFESHNIHDSEVLTDADTLQSALAMDGQYSALYARLESADRIDSFRKRIEADPTLHLDAKTEPEYFAAQVETMTATLTFTAYAISVIMAIGALFGAIHSLYISADSRKVELATLRAIGFGSGSVMTSFLAEALILAAAGGCIGVALAWLFVSGRTASTIAHGLAQVVFHLDVSLHLIGVGVLWACAIGLIGALIPAVRVCRLPVVTALRQ